MNLGKITGETFADYQASGAFGVHALADMEPYPLRFRLKHVTHEIPANEDSPALAFGRYLHCLALEGDDAAGARFIQAPECDRRTKEGKDRYAKFILEAVGREVVGAEDSALAWNMVRAIRAKPGAASLFAVGTPEVVFRHQMRFFALQARCDWFNEKPEGGGPPMIVDLKSIDDLTGFDKHFWAYSYYRQAAFYRQMVKAVLKLDEDPQFVFVVVEKQPPHQVAVRTPDAQSLDIGWRECAATITRLKDCFEANNWPGEPDEARPVSLPEWKSKLSTLTP